MTLFKLSLPLQMALATLLGILVGLFFGELTSVFAPYAAAYILILKITAIPYLIVAIIHGVGLLNRATAKQIFKKGTFFISLALMINISMIYLIKWAFPKFQGTSQTGHILKDIPSLNFSELLIPDNVFYDLANNIVPAVVVFSLLIGISLMHIGDKQMAMSSLQTLLEALKRITGWISLITPIGTFLIMANQAGTIQFSTVKQIGTYIILYIIGTSCVIFWIAPRLTSMLTSVKPLQWLKNLIPVLVLAYTTNLVIVCLPYIISIIQRELQVLFPKDENLQGQIQGTVSIVFNLPLGSMFLCVFVFFISVFYASPLPGQKQIELFLTTFLTSLGAVGLGSWINSLTFILDILALPIDAINFYLASLPFTAGFQSMVSVMLISSLAFLITLACRSLITLNWKKILLHSVFIIVPVVILFGVLKFLVPFPHIKNDAKSIFDLRIESDVEVQVYTNPSDVPPVSVLPDEDPFDRILRTKTLRVGYSPSAAPFAFFNKENLLTGYDVAFALELAHDLQVNVMFVPLTYGKIGQELDENYYDIGMSAISISEQRLKNMCFPSAYLESQIVFVSRDFRRKEFASLDAVRSNANLKIAVIRGSFFEQFARAEFPNHSIILLDKYDDFANVSDADVLIWDEQEAISWSVLNPFYHVIFPSPALGTDSLGYPVKPNAGHFLCYLNAWVKLKKNEGFTQRQYDLWVLGKTDTVIDHEPRWSIIRNVLHWVK